MAAAVADDAADVGGAGAAVVAVVVLGSAVSLPGVRLRGTSLPN